MAVEDFFVTEGGEVVQRLSRDEFFARSTPGQRLFVERQGTGGESIYASAEEYAADIRAAGLANGLPSALVDHAAAEAARSWNP